MAYAFRGAVLAAVVAGAVGGFLLFRSFKDPCAGLLRRYVAAYDAAKACTADAECVIDPMPPRGPGLCDRARSTTRGREQLQSIEASWTDAACPAPGEPCPPAVAARCEKGRCLTALR
jgi:hypothetical protein